MKYLITILILICTASLDAQENFIITKAGKSLVWQDTLGIMYISYGVKAKYQDSNGNWHTIKAEVEPVEPVKNPSSIVRYSRFLQYVEPGRVIFGVDDLIKEIERFNRTTNKTFSLTQSGNWLIPDRYDSCEVFVKIKYPAQKDSVVYIGEMFISEALNSNSNNKILIEKFMKIIGIRRWYMIRMKQK